MHAAPPSGVSDGGPRRRFSSENPDRISHAPAPSRLFSSNRAQRAWCVGGSTVGIVGFFGAWSLWAGLSPRDPSLYLPEAPAPAPEPMRFPNIGAAPAPMPEAIARARAPKASDAEISARLGIPGTAFAGDAATSADAPAPETTATEALERQTRDQRLDDFAFQDVARNGSLVVRKSIEPAVSRALYYLAKSPSFRTVLAALAHGPTTMIAPTSQMTDIDSAPDTRRAVAVIPDENGLPTTANVVEWSSNLGRVAQRGPEADGQIICERQSPAAELMRRLLTSYGTSRHPLTSKMLACIDDPIFGNQDAYRVNRKINRGLLELNELPAQYLGRLAAASGVVGHEACAPKLDPLIDDARKRFPALEDPNANACSALYHAPLAGAEDIAPPDSEAEAPGFASETLRLSNETLADVERLKARSRDLETRVAAAARENGTSPLAFMDEIRENRQATQALVAAVQANAGFARDPNFDVSVREVIYHPPASDETASASATEAPAPGPERAAKAPAAATAPAAGREPQSLREAMMRGVGHSGPSQKVITGVALKPSPIPTFGVR